MRRQGQNWARQTVTLSGGVTTSETVAMSGKAVVQLVLWSGAALLSWRNPTERGRYLMRLWTNIGKLEGVAGVTMRRALQSHDCGDGNISVSRQQPLKGSPRNVELLAMFSHIPEHR